MEIVKRRDNTREGLIIFKVKNRPPIKCTIKKNSIVYIESKCSGCGSNQVIDYKCAYCRKEI